MPLFDYTAVSGNGSKVSGRIEAPNRKGALGALDAQGLFPSSLSPANGAGGVSKPKSPASPKAASTASNSSASSVSKSKGATSLAGAAPPEKSSFTFNRGIRRKDITAFTREMAALLEAAIPIPRALASLGEKEHHVRLKELILTLAEEVKQGKSLSEAMAEHPRNFNALYTSMVKVGEEAGALPNVMTDLADLMEHEDEVRGEVLVAVSYPAFVLVFGVLTVVVLMMFVLPRLFSMLEEMMDVLPLPTLILLSVSGFIQAYWIWLLLGMGAVGYFLFTYLRKPEGLMMLDRIKLRSPVIGPVFLSSALCRFSGTLGVLLKSGVSLLPALEIVRFTVGNRILSDLIQEVSEQTKGGHSLAAPMRQLNFFPATAIQMIEVGEETGCLDNMLLKVSKIEERHMRNKTKAMISLLAPALILVVGVIIGFMVIALLLPIFKMSQNLG